MVAKYVVVVEGRGNAYAGDDSIKAARIYQASVRLSAREGDTGCVVSFYAEGALLEQYQPLGRSHL